MTSAALPYEFRDDERAIRITRPDLPSPWINYLSNGTLHAFVSQAGGGYAWWQSPLKNRLTRYRQYNLPIDSPGFYVYLRTPDGTVWSPTWRPVETPLDTWWAEHRPGRTRFGAHKDGLEAQLELFIAPGENVLVWDLSVTNHRAEPVALDVFGYVEFSLLDWKQDTDWACYVKHNLDVRFDAEAQALIYLYRHFHVNPHLADCPLVYFGASEPVASFDGDRDVFVGDYRSERNAVAAASGACAGSVTSAGDPCGALHCAVDLEPGAARRFGFFLGGEPHAIVGWPRALENVRTTLQRLRRPGMITTLRDRLDSWWADHLTKCQATLPEADVARQVNLWGPVQSVHTGRYSRSVSQHAAGVRTMGFRDTCQDMLAVAYRDPVWARKVLRYLISQQYRDGHFPHQCNPAEKAPAEPRIHIDNPLWVPLLAYAILAETGDLGLLDERVPWLDDDSLNPVGSASIHEHLARIPIFMEANLGRHGIPLIHHGDWNDAIGKFGRRGEGESLFAAQQYVYALGLLAEIAQHRGDCEWAEKLDAVRDKQKQAMLACAWDGGWWRRGFDDDGEPIGSQACAYGKIWLNTQSWAVIAGVGERAQHVQAMDAVAEHLDTGICGIRKLAPGFPSFPEVADPYSGYSPGCGENAAIFCHANTWAIMAEALLGRTGKAWHYYRQLVPHRALQRVGLQRYQAEPYAYVSNIIGPENPKFGWANVAQVTGTAGWMDIVATQYLLGVRPTLAGLVVDPRVPAEWDEFAIRRVVRGCAVEIVARRKETPPGVCAEGRQLATSVVPWEQIAGRQRLTVEVVLPR